ncbi:mRNA interferase RelE/StbE [Thalassococcus halodurans]|uniref:mRNA interferase RelE/StbE n=1 Tax=Thalassococcus halodurans TaxID=373675 RepID=A0A1H5XCW2_9RHOB|nr:cytotoxic translational repressor of toxin-antitoxin stability system [Thalassococcus halodurans]SEG09614.1 mRNA interferase RelE/StbE [Thalassococcus halodurans]
MKEIAYSKTAQKALMRMPRNWAIRVRDKVNAYASDPASQANNVKALRGTNGMLRLRVGDWRVVMCDGVVLEILDVKARGSAYKE